jgi:hypothetical protein
MSMSELEKFEMRNHKLRCDNADYEKYKKSFRRKFENFFYKIFGTRKPWHLIPFVPHWADLYYYEKIRPVFIPRNSRYRKVIPRNWTDVTSLIKIVNFEFIKGFYEGEYLHGNTDWEGTGIHAVEFARWLESAYDYITIERPQLEKDMDNAYPPLRPIEEWFEVCETDKSGKIKILKMKDDGKTYEEKYGEVNRLEKLINDKDTEILIQLIKYRGFFWS